MHPVLFEIFGVPVGSFGVSMSVGFLLATWIMTIRMREVGLDPEHWGTVLLCVVGGSLLGAKLYYAVETWLRDGAPFWALLRPSAGLTWYGGLLGGTLGAWLACRIHGMPLRKLSACIVVGLALGQGIGRIGCFLVGDDYGRPTDLPWGIAFPEGRPPTQVPVHPTQLYEAAALFGVAGILWARRRRSAFLWGDYLLWAGAVRFLVEFWRTNPPVALSLSGAQIVALGAMGAGAALLLGGRLGSRPPRSET